MTVLSSHYETLGVAETASGGEIRAAYRALALRYHPDRHAGNPHFEEQFKQVSAAHRVLGDAERRRLYDLRLLALRERQQAQARQRQAQHAPGAPGSGEGWPVGHRYHYATTRRPATVRERAYGPLRQPRSAAHLHRRDRRALLVVLLLLTTVVGAVARWSDVRHSHRAEEAYLTGILNAEHGNWARALVNWSEAIHYEPNLGAAYARRAEVYAAYQQDYTKALADYDRALHNLAAPAERVRAHTGRGTCLLALGQYSAAEDALAHALDLDPAFTPALLARGEARLYHSHQFGAAIADFSALLRAATATAAECTHAVKLRGLAWLRLQDGPRAGHDFLAALSATDTDGQTWYLLAQAELLQNHQPQAARYMAEARKRGYRPPALFTE